MNISDDYKHLLIQHLNKYFRNCKLTGTEELGKYINSTDGSYRYIVLTFGACPNFLVENGTAKHEILVPYCRILRNLEKSQPDRYISSGEEIRKAFKNIEDWWKVPKVPIELFQRAEEGILGYFTIELTNQLTRH